MKTENKSETGIVFHFDEGGPRELVVWANGDFAHTDEFGRMWALHGDERISTTLRNPETPDFIKAHFDVEVEA